MRKVSVGRWLWTPTCALNEVCTGSTLDLTGSTVVETATHRHQKSGTRCGYANRRQIALAQLLQVACPRVRAESHFVTSEFRAAD